MSRLIVGSWIAWEVRVPNKTIAPAPALIAASGGKASRSSFEGRIAQPPVPDALWQFPIVDWSRVMFISNSAESKYLKPSIPRIYSPSDDPPASADLVGRRWH